jgi:hypothetical protein
VLRVKIRVDLELDLFTLILIRELLLKLVFVLRSPAEVSEDLWELLDLTVLLVIPDLRLLVQQVLQVLLVVLDPLDLQVLLVQRELLEVLVLQVTLDPRVFRVFKV